MIRVLGGREVWGCKCIGLFGEIYLTAYGRDCDTVGWVAENAEYFFNALQKGNALGDYCFWEVLLLKVLDASVLCCGQFCPLFKMGKGNIMEL